MVPEQRPIPACSRPDIGCLQLNSGVWREIFRRSEKFFSTARGGFGPFWESSVDEAFSCRKAFTLPFQPCFSPLKYQQKTMCLQSVTELSVSLSKRLSIG
jgi:hypothetical protein